MSLKLGRITVGINLDTVLFPITFIELISSLEKGGYDINKAIPFPRPIGRFIGSGQIARKGNVGVSVDGGDKSITMIGTSLEDTIEEFDSFLKTLQIDYSLQLDEIASYYQFVAHYEYKTKKDPFSIIGNSCIFPKIEELAKIIETPIKTFSIRFASADNIPNDKNWFDINIAPDVQRNDGYVIDVVYRNEDKEFYRTFISHIEANIVKSIQLLER